ncbi:hypothetical protein D3C85_1531860 [compost metagenome]
MGHFHIDETGNIRGAIILHGALEIVGVEPSATLHVLRCGIDHHIGGPYAADGGRNGEFPLDVLP